MIANYRYGVGQDPEHERETVSFMMAREHSPDPFSQGGFDEVCVLRLASNPDLNDEREQETEIAARAALFTAVGRYGVTSPTSVA